MLAVSLPQTWNLRFFTVPNAGVKSITKWLVGDDAYQIYNDAEQALLNYKPIFDVNNDVYDKVMKFLDKELPERFNDAMAKQCPTGKFKEFY